MSDCSCIYVDDYEYCERIDQKIRKANKQHKCIECHRIIEKDEKYEYYKSLYDGKFETYKTCEDCLSVRKEFFCDGFEFYSMWDSIHNHIHEMCGDIKSSCLVGLTRNARNKICDMIEEYWEDYFDEDDDE